jgi:signal transduction histidine kinase
VWRGGSLVLRSRSLWDHALARPAAGGRSGVQRTAAEGPRHQALALWSRTVQLAGDASSLQVAVGADVSHLDAMTRSFGRTLAVSLAAVALALMAAALLQVRLGLAPLRRLREALLALRDGRATRVEGRFPGEVQPLVDDLHGLLDENTAIVERARTQTANLAHALKTPLAVITNAAMTLPPGEERELIRAQADRMARQVELQLVRARAAATARQRGPGSPVRPAVDDLRRALERLHSERRIEFSVRQEGAPVFIGEQQDLHEMLGNLLDNAAKWARRRVQVSLSGSARRIVCEVEDDGPGIAPAQRATVLQRGGRLDESQPGSGLGLTIVDDIARLHGGSLTLGTSPLGGLLARLELPAAGSA